HVVPVRVLRGFPDPRPPATRRQSLDHARRVLEHPAAVDRGGAGLDRGRVRPPAMVDQRGAARASVRVIGVGERDLVQPLRLRALLRRAPRGRDVPDGQVRAPRAIEPAHGALSLRRGRQAMIYLFDYETLKLIWWLLVGTLLVGFALTDGFDLGVGTLLPF